MTDVNERIQAMVDAVSSGRPLAEVAAERGLPLAELEVWAALYGAARREALRERRRRLAVVGSVAATLVGLVGGVAFAGTCASLLPAPLVTMCPDEPALASELNGNFLTLRNWVLAPPGPVSATSSISAATSITAGTTVTAGSALVTGGGAQVQGLQLQWNTVQPNLGRAELINNRGSGGGGFDFYERNLVSDPSGAPLLTMSRARANFSGAVGGFGALCVVHTACEDSAPFACGQSAACPDGKFVVASTDGTSCNVLNRLRCCALRLTPCP